MNALDRSVQQLFQRVEPLLSHALAHDSRDAFRAARAFLRLYAAPAYTTYAPAEFFHEHKSRFANEHVDLFIEPVSECHADAESLLECLQSVIASVELDRDARLRIELFEETERGERIPRMACSLDGPGHFGDPVNFAHHVRIPFEDFVERWTLATCGGRIDRTPLGWALRLKGVRVPPDPMLEARQLLDILGETSERARMEEALAILDGPPRREPADAHAVLRDALTAYDEAFKQASISIDTLLDLAAPPVLMRRSQITMLFRHCAEYALAQLQPAGSLTVISEYAPEARCLAIEIVFERRGGEPGETAHAASWRRIALAHAGTCAFDRDGHRATLRIVLPDPVGAALDVAIPGWEAFSDRSRQMLRLLKSGASPLPEDFLLGGVLEETLETLLFERLGAPLARNIAVDLKPDNRGLKKSDPERLKKALAQVSRGKPKKEICQPQYAGELIWAFRGDARRRAALGAESLDENELLRLCEALLATPPEYYAGLALLARLATLGATNGPPTQRA